MKFILTVAVLITLHCSAVGQITGDFIKDFNSDDNEGSWQSTEYIKDSVVFKQD